MNGAPQHETMSGRARAALLARAAVLLLTAGVAGCDVPPTGAATPMPPSPGEAERGLRLLSQYQCGSCHAIPEVPGAQGGIGGTLHAFGKRSYIGGQLPNSPVTLARWIADPAALIPGTAMPDMGASEEDARDMAAYLLTLE